MSSTQGEIEQKNKPIIVAEDPSIRASMTREERRERAKERSKIVFDALRAGAEGANDEEFALDELPTEAPPIENVLQISKEEARRLLDEILAGVYDDKPEVAQEIKNDVLRGMFTNENGEEVDTYTHPANGYMMWDK